MTTEDIARALQKGTQFTYANPVIDYDPQKEHPNCIHITARRNLIDYNSKLSVWTADINTAKLHWNSVVSTDDANYMCLDIKNSWI